ncbi:MAG: phosphoribosyltransferase [Pseudomonadota bacterium]
MMFRDREDAARQLAGRLKSWKGRHPLVLAIPRGAVPMGAIIAEALEGDLDVVLVHKLGAPGNPEFAIGAVDESGHIHVADHAAMTGASQDEIDAEARAQLATLRKRRAQYTPVRPPLDPAGRVVIVVDDGVATGATVMAALQAIRSKKPERLILAIGVAPPDTLNRLRPLVDELVCLHSQAEFWAVGQFFADFRQVEDEEAMDILRRFGERRSASPA